MQSYGKIAPPGGDGGEGEIWNQAEKSPRRPTSSKLLDFARIVSILYGQWRAGIAVEYPGRSENVDGSISLRPLRPRFAGFE